MIRVAILGATGYTAVELMKLLLRHPDVEITTLTTRQEGRPHVGSIHPALAARLDLELENLEPEQVAARSDCVFCCLPHGASAAAIVRILDAGVRVVDFSADYRLDDPQVFAKWYDQKHPDPDRMASVVYGLPELFFDKIANAPLVANPGCFPTTAILALSPFLKAGIIESKSIIIDSKSGVSGAGRTPKLTTHYPECNENVSAYNIGRHRHTPEIELILGKIAETPVEVVFTPHLVPMDRGILSTTYSVPKRDVTENELLDVMREFYVDMPFVRVVEHLPATKDTAFTNFCDVTVRIVRDRIITISCLDNLIKGASGAAVQNFNIMHGFDQTTALL